MNFEEWLPTIQEFSIEYDLLALKALAIFFIGRMIAKILRNIADRVMKRDVHIFNHNHN